MSAKRMQVWDGIKKADHPLDWKATFASTIHILFCQHQAAARCAHLKQIHIWYNKMGFLNYNIRYIQCLNPRDMMDSAITKNYCSCTWDCRGVNSMVHTSRPQTSLTQPKHWI